MRGSEGFTLLEVIVALALGAMVVLLAHRMFAAVMDGSIRLSDTGAALDREANARRLLTQLVGSLDVGQPESGDFNGEPQRAAFSAWYPGPEGWPERRRVTLEADRNALVVSVGGESIVLADDVEALDLDYLLDYGADAPWLRTWQSPVSAPLAIRARITYRRQADTLLLIIGPRG